jgi:hypothetical protein
VTGTNRILAPLLLASTFCGLAGAANGHDPIEYLDEQTAATVTAVYQPLVFARERRDVAANLRDYVTLVAASVNRSGNISYVLIAYFWSTVDARVGGDAPVVDPIVLAADDRRIELKRSGTRAEEQGIALPIHAPPNHKTEPVVYRTDLATLRFLGATRRLELRTGTDELAPVYEIWDDERDELASFVAFMNGER